MSKHLGSPALKSTGKALEIKTFLDFAVWLNLAGYVRSKAPTMTRTEVLHAAEFKGLQHEDELFKFDHLKRPLLSLGFVADCMIWDGAVIYRNPSSGQVYLKGQMPMTDLPASRKNLELELSSGLRYHAKERRKSKWVRTKKLFLG